MNKRLLITLATLAILTGQGCQIQKNPSKMAKQTFLYKYGVPVSEREWNTRGKIGKVITTLNNGITISRSYSKGVLEGDTTQTFPHTNTVESIKTYENGTLIKEKINFVSGAPMREINHPSSAESVVTIWYNSGSPSSIEYYNNNRLISGEYFNVRNEVESTVAEGNGTRANRDPFGSLLSRDSFTEGRITESITYHDDNTPSSITPYYENIVHGTKKTFYLNGSPKTIEEWSNGRQSGLTTLFKNGVKVAEINYRRGKKDGIERRFDEYANLIAEINWINDERHGATNTFFSGEVTTDWFLENYPVSKLTYDQYQQL
ncbi:hypothetical protein JYU14_00395, partial [Simkania negevensis]|nr:hypothetical protein [Simkania negevensis]